ncbi:hypothetical protein C8R46DRAFT_237794 [Mycena filopes]|nr:hypothetical protein C8R46DRAFT_237794 [Mycena filopes]
MYPFAGGAAERDIVRDIKEPLCYVRYIALDFEKDRRRRRVAYKLPDVQVIFVGNERFRAPEALFQPHLLRSVSVGILTPKRRMTHLPSFSPIFLFSFSSILLTAAQRYYHSIHAMWMLAGSSSAISGGTTMFFGSRFKSASDSVWIGGFILASLSTF